MRVSLGNLLYWMFTVTGIAVALTSAMLAAFPFLVEELLYLMYPTEMQEAYLGLLPRDYYGLYMELSDGLPFYESGDGGERGYINYMVLGGVAVFGLMLFGLGRVCRYVLASR